MREPSRYYRQSIGFSYWRGRTTDREEAGASDLKGMRQFCKERKVERSYVITKNLDDFGALTVIIFLFCKDFFR